MSTLPPLPPTKPTLAARWVPRLFFAALLALGLGIYRDYGISYDEHQSRRNGMISLRHVAEKVAPAWAAHDPQLALHPEVLADYLDRDYGVFFELPASLLERLLHLNEPGQWYRLRHLLTFLVCAAGVWAVYRLGTERYADWRLGLVAAGALVLSPRLFAEMFYNDKDAVFMALFALGTYASVRWLTQPTWRGAVVSGLVCAATIDIRIMGILLPLVAVAVLGWQVLQGSLAPARALRLGALYLAVLVTTTVACWPYLWPAPANNFWLAFQNMRQFRWDASVVYFGREIKATELPWHYAPAWIAVTTPLLYLAAFGVGAPVVLGQVARRGWRLWQGPAELHDALMLAFCLGPLVAVVAFHSVLYDGWRQLYFIYPGLLLVALRGAVALGRWPWALARIGSRRWRAGLGGIAALSIAPAAWSMVRDHPLQNVYFNPLVGSTDLRQYIELDYWGLSYQQGLRWIADHDTRPVVCVHAPIMTVPAVENHTLLPAAARQRLRLVSTPDSADYLISNYRWQPGLSWRTDGVYDVYANGGRQVVLSVFKLRP